MGKNRPSPSCAVTEFFHNKLSMNSLKLMTKITVKRIRSKDLSSVVTIKQWTLVYGLCITAFAEGAEFSEFIDRASSNEKALMQRHKTCRSDVNSEL